MNIEEYPYVPPLSAESFGMVSPTVLAAVQRAAITRGLQGEPAGDLSAEDLADQLAEQVDELRLVADQGGQALMRQLLTVAADAVIALESLGSRTMRRAGEQGLEALAEGVGYR